MPDVNGRMAKFIYVGALALAVILAIICKFSIQSSFSTWFSMSSCDTDACWGNYAVYRFSFALAIWFLILMLLIILDPLLHYSWWSIKFVSYVTLIILAFLIPNAFFTGWADLSRFVSCLFLIFQIVVLIESAYNLHDWILNTKITSEDGQSEDIVWKCIYLLLCGSLIVAAIVGTALLFQWYGACALNQFFIALTLIFGVVGILLSIMKAIDKGLLVPSLVWCYGVFLCWQSIYSEPYPSCNPNANNPNNIVILIVGIVIAAASLTYTIWSTSNGMASLFRQHKENEDDAADPAPVKSAPVEKSADGVDVPRSSVGGDVELQGKGDAQIQGRDHNVARRKRHWVFHLLMAMGSFYMSMLLTNWGAQDGAKQSLATGVSLQSMWVKIVSQWLTYVLYIWTLVGPVLFPDRDFS